MFCYQKNFFSPTLPVDEMQFDALVKAPKWKNCIDQYRKTGDARFKRRLPAFIFQATFDETLSKTGKMDRWRKQAATRLTGLCVMDIDHVEEPYKVFEGWKQGLDLKALGILLVYVTPSGRGLKVVFKARMEWGNLIDNQHRMARLLGVEVDESCKDASRMSFICKEEDILLLDKELFVWEDEEYGRRFDEEYREGRSEASEGVGGSDGDDGLNGVNGLDGEAQATQTAQEAQAPQAPLAFKGVPYATIIERWWERQGGVPQEGERNVKLYQLAVNLRSICDNSREVLMRVMPRLGLDEQELASIVGSACKEPPKGISRMMREVVGMAGVSLKEVVNAPIEDMNEQLTSWGEQIEALFDTFPALKDACKGLKRNQYPAAVFVAGGLMMTLMTRCTYRFYHRPEELRRLNNSTFIIGDPASGKSFATRLYKLLTAPIVAADQVGKDAINAYREEMRTKGANKDKPKKPKVVVRIHPARTSNAQFIQDMVNAVELVDGEPMHLHMLTFDTELDNTVSVQKGGSWIDKQSLELKAFHNEEDGQAYSNNDSIIQDFNVFWNFIYTGTPIALKRKVNEQNFGSGLATRLTCIPLPSTNFEMMAREVNVDMESDLRLKDYAEKLDKTKGELPVAKLVDALYEWTARRMEDARENDSKADEMLLKRCAYHGLNFSVPFIVLRHWESMHEDGQYWCGTFETDEVDWQLAELLVNIQYACQRHYFGTLAETYFDNKVREANVNVKRQQKTVEAFRRLPDEFATEDVMRCFGFDNTGSVHVKIKRLMDDHLVEKAGTFVKNGCSMARYRKTGVAML